MGSDDVSVQSVLGLHLLLLLLIQQSMAQRHEYFQTETSIM